MSVASGMASHAHAHRRDGAMREVEISTSCLCGCTSFKSNTNGQIYSKEGRCSLAEHEYLRQCNSYPQSARGVHAKLLRVQESHLLEAAIAQFSDPCPLMRKVKSNAIQTVMNVSPNGGICSEARSPLPSRQHHSRTYSIFLP